LLELGDEAVTRLARRGYTLDLAVIGELFERRNSSIEAADALCPESKKVSAEFGVTAKFL
jgi:seryl-tRNA synthetase